MIPQFVKTLADADGTSCTSDGYCSNLPQAAANSDNLQKVLSIIIGTFAAVAVLIIVIAALNFVTASGDPAKAAKARTTIIYALVGLVICISAEVLVSFVLGRL